MRCCISWAYLAPSLSLIKAARSSSGFFFRICLCFGGCAELRILVFKVLILTFVRCALSQRGPFQGSDPLPPSQHVPQEVERRID